MIINITIVIVESEEADMLSHTCTENELPASPHEARCECGQLIAKLRKDGVELKCKRCKRIVLIPFESIER